MIQHGISVQQQGQQSQLFPPIPVNTSKSSCSITTSKVFIVLTLFFGVLNLLSYASTGDMWGLSSELIQGFIFIFAANGFFNRVTKHAKWFNYMFAIYSVIFALLFHIIMMEKVENNDEQVYGEWVKGTKRHERRDREKRNRVGKSSDWDSNESDDWENEIRRVLEDQQQEEENYDGKGIQEINTIDENNNNNDSKDNQVNSEKEVEEQNQYGDYNDQEEDREWDGNQVTPEMREISRKVIWGATIGNVVFRGLFMLLYWNAYRCLAQWDKELVDFKIQNDRYQQQLVQQQQGGVVVQQQQQQQQVEVAVQGIPVQQQAQNYDYPVQQNQNYQQGQYQQFQDSQDQAMQ